MYDIILTDLLKVFGGKLLLDSSDLAIVTGISNKQQSALIAANKLPINSRKLGNRLVYSIYEVAKYLSSFSDSLSKEEIKKEPLLNRVEKKKTKSRLQKTWWLDFHSQLISLHQKALITNIDITSMTHKRTTYL